MSETITITIRGEIAGSPRDDLQTVHLDGPFATLESARQRMERWLYHGEIFAADPFALPYIQVVRERNNRDDSIRPNLCADE